MNRKLLVTLLQKNIQELELITQGFMEMTVYPMPIIVLAQRKTEDIQLYLKELSEIKNEKYTEDKSISDKIEQISFTEDKDVLEASIEEIHIDDNQVEENEVIVEIVVEEIALETNHIDINNEVVLFESEVTANEIIDVEEIEEIDNSSDEEIVEVINIQEVEVEKEIIEIIQEIETPQPEKMVLEESRKTILGERSISGVHTRNEILSHTDNSISATLANKKITDIKQAISIGDRFRFQRELFRANGEDMNKTLTYINQLATLEEVLSFLKSKYGWANNNEAAEDFYQIVKRRFI